MISRSGDTSSDEDPFEEVEGTQSARADSLQRGDHVCLSNGTIPCRVLDIKVTKPFKNRVVKAIISGVDMFNPSRKYDEVIPGAKLVRVPIVERREYTVIDVTPEGGLSLLERARGGEMREDLDLPPDQRLAAQIRLAFHAGKEVVVVVHAAMGTEQVVECKVADAADQAAGVGGVAEQVDGPAVSSAAS